MKVPNTKMKEHLFLNKVRKRKVLTPKRKKKKRKIVMRKTSFRKVLMRELSSRVHLLNSKRKRRQEEEVLVWSKILKRIKWNKLWILIRLKNNLTGLNQ